MTFEHASSVRIQAEVDQVWQVVADLERWPEWTPTVTHLAVSDGRGADAGNLREGRWSS